MVPLDAFPIVSTREIDLAEATMSQQLTDLRLMRARNRENFGLTMNGVHLGDASLSYTRFDSDTVINTDALDDAVSILIGVDKPSTIYLDDIRIPTNKQAAVAAPPRSVCHHYTGGGGFLLFRVDYDILERRLVTVLDRPLREPILFESSVELEKPFGMNLQQVANFLISGAARDTSVFINPLLKSSYSELVVNTLLSTPSNYSEELAAGPSAKVAPAVVRRAEAYLESMATEAVTIDQLVRECACSRRALFKTFRDVRGYTPMEFLSNCRMRAARKALQAARQEDTVSSIAYDSGFSHPSRFSAAYQKQFGELPSETLRKSRQAR